MPYHVIQFIRPDTGMTGFLSKNRELNLIYVTEGISYNTIITQDESMARSIYDHAKGFTAIEPWISFTNDLMSYLSRAMPGRAGLVIEQYEVIEHPHAVELKKLISLAGL